MMRFPSHSSFSTPLALTSLPPTSSRSFPTPSVDSQWEEQKAQKEDRFLRGRQIANMIHECFQVTGNHETILNFSGSSASGSGFTEAQGLTSSRALLWSPSARTLPVENIAATGSCLFSGAAHQTDLARNVFAATVREYNIDSAPRSCVYEGCHRWRHGLKHESCVELSSRRVRASPE